MTGPTPVPLDPGDLPASYGRNRLVLLPVDPYLIHVYWDLASTSPPAAGARAILRFHESAPASGIEQTRPFDVDVDFTTTSWYVNLWSPDKIYYADLGWRNEDGSFLELARSNTVHTPPAWPRPIGPIEPVEPVEPIATPDPATMSESEQPPVREADPGPEPEPEPLPELDAVEPMRFEPVAIPVNFGEEIPGEPSQLEAPIPSTGYDLTQLSEDHFTPGISSDSEGSFGK